MDHGKVEAVKNWPTQKTVREIHSFLGLFDYYQHFVEGFSGIASPLTRLTRKGVEFCWLDNCDKSFQELKQRLTSFLVLAILIGIEGFTIYNDVLKFGLGLF